MIVIVVASLALQLTALGWAVALWIRTRKGWLVMLCLAVACLAIRQALAVYHVAAGNAAPGGWGLAAETAVLAMSALMVPTVVGIGRLFRERAWVEASLRESGSRAQHDYRELRALYDNAPIGMCVIDRLFRYANVNERLARVNGRGVEEHLGRPLRDIIPGLAGVVEEHVRRVFETGQPLLDVEVSGPSAADPTDMRDWNVTYYPVRDESGGLAAVGCTVIDVTERSRATRELRRSEETKRALLVAIPDAMFRMNREGVYLSYHCRDESRLIVPPEEFLGRRAADVLPPEIAARSMEAIGAALRTGQIQTYEYQYARSGPPSTTWEVRVVVSGPDEVLMVVRDITERRRADDELRASREELERAQVVGQIGSWVYDRTNGKLSWSRQTLRIFGIEPEEFDGRVETFFRHVHPDDVAAIEAAAETARNGNSAYSVDHRIVRRDGNIRWVHEQADVVFDEAGNAVQMIGVVQDITGRKQAEESLATSERRYRLLFELNPQPMWVFDKETLRFLAVNQAAIEHYGYSRERFLSMTIRDIRPAEEIPALEADLANAGGQRGDKRDEGRVWRHRKNTGEIIEVAIVADSIEFYGRAARLVVAMDVTAQLRAERALRESEERYRRLAEHGAVGIWEVDTQGRTLYANPTMRRMLEAEDAATLRQIPFERFFTADSFARVRQEQERRRRGISSSYEVELVGAKGGRRIAVVSGAPMLVPEQELTSFIGTFTDITDRKLAEEARAFSEKRFRGVVDSNMIGIFLWSLQGQVTEANDLFLSMVGYTREDLEAGRINLDRMTPPEFAEVDRRGIEAIRSTGVCPPYEKEYVRKDGRRIPVLLGAAVLDDSRETGVCFIVDITDRRRAERELRDAEQKYRSLFTHTPLGVIMWDAEGRAVEWSPSAEAIFGFPAQEALGRRVHDLIVPARSRAQVDRMWKSIVAGTAGTRSTHENITSDGRTILCEWYNSPLLAEDGTAFGVASLVQDVTEVRRLEEELRQRQKMEAIGQLASGVAHDFSNLLTAIFGFTSLARRTLSPQHPAVRSLDRVDDAAKQAVGVTRALLTFSRGNTTEKRPVALGQVVEDAVRLLRRTLPTNIEVRTHISSTPAWVVADTTQLQQVVMNLAINARDAMPQGGTMTLAVGSASPAARRNGDRGEVFLSVGDTGVGMTPETRGRIFEPFYTTKPPGQGTGLGLPIIHGIVKDHAGRIDVQSEPGKGSTFTVYLPASGSAPEPRPMPEAADTPVSEESAGIILAVRRNFTRELMAATLRSAGCRVEQVADYGGLERELWGQPPRAGLVIVEEGILAEHDGDALAKIIAGTIPAILLADEGSRAEPRGVMRVLTKPFQMVDLAAAVKEALR